jgi:hypothetical protein
MLIHQMVVVVEVEVGVVIIIQTLERHLEEKWHKFSFGTLFMNNNSIVGNLGVKICMVDLVVRVGRMAAQWQKRGGILHQVVKY